MILKRGLFYLISFELFFVLFQFAGRFKADPRFSWIPIDLTLLFLAISMMIGIYLIVCKKIKITVSKFKYFSVYVYLIVFALLSLIWTSSSVYSYDKTFHLFVTVLWSLAGGLMISEDRKRILKFLIITLIFSFWIAIESLLFFQESDGAFIKALGGNYLGIGRILGIGFILIIFYIVLKKKNWKMNMIALSLAILYLYLLFNAGGRGPLIATILSLSILGLHYIKFENGTILIKRNIVWVIAAFCISAFIFISTLLSDKLPQTLQRLLLLFNDEDKGASAETRLYYYDQSIELIKEKIFFGYGIGSWPVELGFPDTRNYPHNIFIEVQFELGVVGLILLLMLMIIPLKNGFLNYKKDYLYIILISLFLNTFINAFISGDISDNRLLFTFLGLLLFKCKIKEPIN